MPTEKKTHYRGHKQPKNHPWKTRRIHRRDELPEEINVSDFSGYAPQKRGRA